MYVLFKIRIAEKSWKNKSFIYDISWINRFFFIDFLVLDILSKSNLLDKNMTFANDNYIIQSVIMNVSLCLSPTTIFISGVLVN